MTTVNKEFEIKLEESNGQLTLAITGYIGKAEKVIIPEFIGEIPVTTVKSLGYYPEYYHKRVTVVILPKSVVSIEKHAFNDFENIREIVVDEQNPVYASYDGVLFDKNMTTLILHPYGKEGDYTVPDSVNTIVSQSFFCCFSAASH